jgi:hypothetical protein
VSGDDVVPFARPILSFGGPIDAAALSLNIYGDDLDPDEITGLWRRRRRTVPASGTACDRAARLS